MSGTPAVRLPPGAPRPGLSLGFGMFPAGGKGASDCLLSHERGTVAAVELSLGMSLREPGTEVLGSEIQAH